jgi:hypothetical protein
MEPNTSDMVVNKQTTPPSSISDYPSRVIYLLFVNKRYISATAEDYE